ncbi:MAG: NADH-quinone oxidoreductase subunit K [Bacteroidales bacterium]|nr:NADH-quinone oxidoreductase subunit K [Bacteroidales bacterium]
MKEIILMLFIITLFVMATANRLRTYVKLVMAQGLLLFVLALVQLNEITVGNLVWIAVETLLFKSVAVPAFLFRLINRNKITREAEPFLPHFASLAITVAIVAGMYALIGAVGDGRIGKFFFVTSMSAILFGLYFICSRRKLLSHLIGYMVIENGVFILTLAVGNHMPFLVNLGVLLDIFASVLLLGFFAGKIGDVFKSTDVDSLTTLKD